MSSVWMPVSQVHGILCAKYGVLEALQTVWHFRLFPETVPPNHSLGSVINLAGMKVSISNCSPSFSSNLSEQVPKKTPKFSMSPQLQVYAIADQVFQNRYHNV